MPEFAAAAPRVALLARAGKAADSLADALRQSGAELLVVVDPADTDEAALRALGPQAVLVALEPSIEPALDRLDALLTDPDLTVIFDEAELAAHRAGWDAARWVRHLSAKLRRDDNVLPPGGEPEQEDLQPSPGAVPKPATAFTELDFDAFAREAAQLAGNVPVDGLPADATPAAPATPPVQGFAPAPVAAPAPPEPVSFAGLSLEPIEPAPKAGAAPPPLPSFDRDAIEVSLDSLDLEAVSFDGDAFDARAVERVGLESGGLESAGLESVELDSADLDASAFDAHTFDTGAFDANTFDANSFDSMRIEAGALEASTLDAGALDASTFEQGTLDEAALDEAALARSPDAASSGVAPISFDDDAFFLEELSMSSTAADAPPRAALDDPGFDLTFDAPAPAAPPAEDVMSLEALFASSIEAAREVPEATQRTTLPAADAPAPPPAAPSFSFEGLSLASDDAPAAPIEAPRAAPPSHDLSALEARISGLSLVDLDAGPASGGGLGVDAGGHGAVVIEAGLGGPDPTRQLLAALPPEFPAVVLVRLHLQGGRYDRLVAQMQRAAAMPVALAEAGAIASPGTIYFLPEGIDVHPGSDDLAFIADPAPGAQLFATLAPGRTALIFLSGGDAQLVDAAMAASAAGALVLAQAPEDCYDGETCAELRRRGAGAGLPAELAAKLAARWPSRSQA